MQEFLVMAGRKLDVMFGAVYRGEKPLWPRLARSLRNFCNSVARGEKRRDVPLEDLVASGYSPVDERDPDDEESRQVREEKARQDRRDAVQETVSHMVSIRHALPDKWEVPFLQLVLLKAALSLLAKICHAHVLENGSIPAGFSGVVEVEKLYLWTRPEKERQLPPKGRPLLEVWRELAAQADPPGFTVNRKAIAKALGMPVNTLTTYLLRARRIARDEMERLLGTTTCTELFRDWFC